jgi:hypothetical protein
MAKTNRYSVLEVLMANPYRHLSVERIREAVELDLTRRQIITALHGLRDGLGDQLTLSAAGTWLYAPPPQESRCSSAPNIPVGWERRCRVVAKFGPNSFLVMPLDEDGEPTGAYLWAHAIEGSIEWMDTEDLESGPPVRLP